MASDSGCTDRVVEQRGRQDFARSGAGPRERGSRRLSEVGGVQPTVMALDSRVSAEDAPTTMRTRPEGVTHPCVPTSQ